MLHELFGLRLRRLFAGSTAIVLMLAAELVRTVSIVVGGRTGRSSASTRGVQRGWQSAIVLPVRGSCAPPGGRISTLGVGIRTSATSCAQNGATHATQPPLWRARRICSRNAC